MRVGSLPSPSPPSSAPSPLKIKIEKGVSYQKDSLEKIKPSSASDSLPSLWKRLVHFAEWMLDILTCGAFREHGMELILKDPSEAAKKFAKNPLKEIELLLDEFLAYPDEVLSKCRFELGKVRQFAQSFVKEFDPSKNKDKLAKFFVGKRSENIEAMRALLDLNSANLDKEAEEVFDQLVELSFSCWIVPLLEFFSSAFTKLIARLNPEWEKAGFQQADSLQNKKANEFLQKFFREGVIELKEKFLGDKERLKKFYFSLVKRNGEFDSKGRKNKERKGFEWPAIVEEFSRTFGLSKDFLHFLIKEVIEENEENPFSLLFYSPEELGLINFKEMINYWDLFKKNLTTFLSKATFPFIKEGLRIIGKEHLFGALLWGKIEKIENNPEKKRLFLEKLARGLMEWAELAPSNEKR